jgi:hypothetical protein
MMIGINASIHLTARLQQADGNPSKGRRIFRGDDVPAPIVEGTVDGDRVAFKSGSSDFKGAVKGDHIELQWSVNLPWESPKPPQEEPGRSAIGPAPDGSDPSIDVTWDLPSSVSVVLRRVGR